MSNMKLKELRKLAVRSNSTSAESIQNLKQKPADTAKPAAPKSTAVIDQSLWGETLSDQPGSTTGYTYEIGGDGKSLTYKETGSTGQMKPLNQSYSKWDQVVVAINALGAKLSVGQPQADNTKIDPAATPQNATTKPAEAAAQGASKTVLAEVLQAMYNDKLVETKGINLTNEKKMAIVFMDGIAGGVGSGARQSANAANYMLTLASYLTSTIPATTEEALTNLPFLQTLQKALNSIYTAAFNYSKVTDPKLFKILSVRPGMKESVRMMKIYLDRMIKHPTQASSKYTAKIIRLASLRRLRVRSEMEAAITGSAMPGRDRVI